MYSVVVYMPVQRNHNKTVPNKHGLKEWKMTVDYNDCLKLGLVCLPLAYWISCLNCDYDPLLWISQFGSDHEVSSCRISQSGLLQSERDILKDKWL